MSTEQPTTPLLSLVTGTMDRHQSLSRLIESIKKHTRVSWELIIADASELPLYINDPRITRLVERPRLGHTKGYNAAFKLCKGTWVLWLNDDAEVLQGYDTESIEFMRAHPECGMGAVAYNELRADGTWCGFHTNNYRGLPFANFGMLERTYGEKLGWFDERFYMYGADNSLAFKVFMDDKVVLPIPGQHILHYSPKDEQRAANEKYREQSRELFKSYDPYMMKMYDTYHRHTGVDLGPRRHFQEKLRSARVPLPNVPSRMARPVNPNRPPKRGIKLS